MHTGLGASRRAVPFDTILAATPHRLLEKNIYGQIACPLKAGAYREASMVIVTQAIASIMNTHHGPTLLRTLSSLSDLRSSFNSS